MKKRKDGRYQKVVTIDGKKRTFYGHTQAEITKKIREWQEKVDNGEKFSAVAEEWWEAHSPTLANNTIKPYLPAYRRAVQEFGGVYIKDITPNMINKYIISFAKTYADKTVRTQLMVFNLIFRHGVTNGYIQYNPAVEVRVPKNLPKKKIEMPTEEEIEIVKNSYDKTFGAFAYWIMYTGMRKGELLALTWEDVDEENREITVSKSIEHVNCNPYVKSPKTESGYRVIPILDKLHEKIQYKKKGVVFPGASGGYIKEYEYNRLWELYQKETGTSFSAHQLRHGFTTMLIENDTPIEVAQYILGHAQISTTMDIYAQLRNKRRKDVYQKLQNVDI